MILVKIIKKTLTLVEIVKNLDFGQNYKSSKNLDFCQNCRKLSILVKTYQNGDFAQDFIWMLIIVKCFEQCRYLQMSRFLSKFMKISILVKTVGKPWSWSTISENLDFSQYHRENRFGIFFLQILVLVKISENVDLGQNLQICRFGSKISKNVDFGQNFRKYRFWWKLLKISNLVKFVEKSRLWSKCKEMSIVLMRWQKL